MKYLTRTVSTLGRNTSSSEPRNRPESRVNRSTRYTYLEDSSMSRAMYRL